MTIYTQKYITNIMRFDLDVYTKILRKIVLPTYQKNGKSNNTILIFNNISVSGNRMTNSDDHILISVFYLIDKYILGIFDNTWR